MDAILTDAEALWGPLDDADSPDDIITRFACSVRDDERDWLYEFHFACHQRDVIWDDCENYRLEIEDPAVAVGFEVLEMSDGRIEAITPRGMCLLLVSGPNRKAISGALRSALLLENQRTIEPERSDHFLPLIEKELMKVRAGIFENFRLSSSQEAT